MRSLAEFLRDWQAILGGLFIVLGAIVFYVSGLISGRSLFRDSPSMAAFISAAAGIILFLLSPACFWLLDHSLFGGVVQETWFDIWPDERGDIDSYLARLLSLSGTYLLSVVGLGLSLGCWTLLGARVNVLRWARERSGVHFGIRTYTQAWEHLIARTKSGALIHVTTEDGTIYTGTLKSWSVGEEPRELVLDNCVQGRLPLSRWVKSAERNQVLVSPESRIRRMEVPRHSLKRHQDDLSHASQACFTALSALGFLLLSWSCHEAGGFLRGTGYVSLGRLYLVGAIGLATLAMLLVVLGLYMLRSGYQRPTSAFALAPGATVALSTVFTGTLAWWVHTLLALSPAVPRQDSFGWYVLLVGLMMAALGFICFNVWRWRKVKWFLLETSRRTIPDEALRSRVVSWFYLAFDLQQEPYAEYDRLRRQVSVLFTARVPGDLMPEYVHVQRFFEELKRFIDAHSYLENEHFHVMERLRWLTGQREPHGWGSCSSGGATAAQRSSRVQ